MTNGDVAVLRCQSTIDIADQEHGPLECWHLDCYHRDERDGAWRVRWSQATETLRRQPSSD